MPAHRLRQPLLAGFVRVFVAELLVVPTGILTVAFLTRRLGPGGYGLLVIAGTYVDWLEWAVTSSFTRATVKFVSEADDWRPVATAAIRMQFLASVVAGLALFLLARPIGRLMQEPVIEGYLRLYALDLPVFCLAQAHRDVLVGLGYFKERAYASGLRWIARLAIIVALVEAGLSIEGAILGGISSSFVELLVCRRYVRPPLFRRSPFPMKRLWEYVAPLSLFSLCKKLYDKVDLLALKALGASAVVAGHYGGAQSLASLPGLFASALAPLLLSSLGESLKAGRVEHARDKGRRALRAMMWSLPIAGLLAGAGEDLVGTVMGEAFLPSVPLVEILLFASVGLSMISFVTSILIAAGKPGWTLAVTVPLLLVAILGHVLVIPTWGASGAAWVTTVCAFGGAIISVALAYRIWRIAPPLATVLRTASVAALAYVVGTHWPVSGVWIPLKLVTIAAGMLAYLGLAGEFGTEDVRRIGLLLRAWAKKAVPAGDAADAPAAPRNRYWTRVFSDWEAEPPQRLWRRHNDAVDGRLFARLLPPVKVDRLLNTDLFGEALYSGLYWTLESRATSVVGIDVSVATARAAGRRFDGLRCVGADVRQLPFEDRAFDVVVSSSTLDHFESLEDVGATLREIYRVVDAGGYLLMTLDNRSNPAVALRNALPVRLLNRLGLVPYHVGAACGPSRLRALVESAGFDVIEVGAALHCPRLLAVAVCNLLERWASPSIQSRFVRCLMPFERLSALPTRFVTGHYVSIKARKPPSVPEVS
jgi:O-antigen/teichoic acid export membrane protein/SAM-dependent methyltransferase